MVINFRVLLQRFFQYSILLLQVNNPVYDLL